MFPIDIKVKSEMYGTTTCVVNVEDFKKGIRTFPCGDGCDHTLTDVQVRKVQRIIRKGEN